MALVKKDNFELVAQKVTEIGVTHIVPILCEHSEKRKLNTERLNKIVIRGTSIKRKITRHKRDKNIYKITVAWPPSNTNIPIKNKIKTKINEITGVCLNTSLSLISELCISS
jgi:16S rRNA U1498 N3-methylase RsmE